MAERICKCKYFGQIRDGIYYVIYYAYLTFPASRLQHLSLQSSVSLHGNMVWGFPHLALLFLCNKLNDDVANRNHH